MASQPAELLRAATRRHTGTLVAGALLGLAVYALVAGAPRLYETEAVLSAPAPDLLEQYAQMMSNDDPSQPRVASRDGELDRTDLGDVAGIAARARSGLGRLPSTSEVALRIDDVAGEAAVIVRARDPRAARLMAGEIAAGIIDTRNAAMAKQHASVRAELRLIATLADRDGRLRSRADALRAHLAVLAQLRRSPGSGVSILRAAPTPTEPVSPRVTRDVTLAAVTGMLGWVTLTRLRAGASTRRRRLRPSAA